MIYYCIGIWRRFYPLTVRFRMTIYWHVVRTRYQGGYLSPAQKLHRATQEKQG